MNMRFLQYSVALILCVITTFPQAHAGRWDLDRLCRVPPTYPAPDWKEAGVEALFYEALPWKGKSTRAFAWIGMPDHAPGEKVPGIVLVHGGGGTAFADWVRLWNKRGYAAIAMDTCGSQPGGVHNQRPRHDLGGPPGWGGFDQVDQPPEDQWAYHAVADVILAHSLLRSRPDVDATRIGLTGISWGGYLTCIVAGVDRRFQFAVPVYGCGFLGDNSLWKDSLDGMHARGRKWLEMWDPSHYLPAANIPMLWVTGTNDFAYPLDSAQKSYRLATGARTVVTRLRMPHGHGGPGENPEEIRAFADGILKGGPPLTKITGQGHQGGEVWVKFSAARPPAKAELLFTKSAAGWKDRPWEAIPATLASNQAGATLPEGATAWFVNITDPLGLVVSSELQQP